MRDIEIEEILKITSGITVPRGYEEILTKDEVKALTGRTHRAEQIDWLINNKWKFELNAAKDPIVGRWYLKLKLAGIDQPGCIRARCRISRKLSDGQARGYA